MYQQSAIYFGLLLLPMIGIANAMTMDEAISSATENSDEEKALNIEEMDMIFTPEQKAEIRQDEEKSGDLSGRQRRKASQSKYRWTGKVVPYEFAPNPLHCYSYIGMIGGIQKVGLEQPGCIYKGIVVHEVGHALGFVHEHSRPDRDDYITVVTTNIRSDMVHNFHKYTSKTIGDFNVLYDYRSIMQYGPKAFSTNGQVTIYTKDPKFQNVIGQRTRLSFRDIKLANLMYSCNANCDKKTCPGEGFVDESCQCMCPGHPIKKCYECTPNPCLNGGTCKEGEGVNGFTCNCAAGYVGNICATKCTPNPCLNGGTCGEGEGVNDFTCNCVAGYTGNICATNIDECSSSPCENGGKCQDQVNAYTCNCAVRYTGDRCQTVKSCDDKWKACDNWEKYGYCNDGHYNFYMRMYCAKTCKFCADMDECAPNPCLNGGTCTDKEYGFTCNCVAGYAGNICATNIDDCSSRPCGNGGRCTDQVNAYTCNCYAGYTGDRCQTVLPSICEDKSKSCANREKYGYCNRIFTRSYMRRFCAKTCKFCSDSN